jgi:hypothetical protein
VGHGITGEERETLRWQNFSTAIKLKVKEEIRTVERDCRRSSEGKEHDEAENGKLGRHDE